MSELPLDHWRLMELAKKVIPGGVNSPVRAFNAVGGVPVFMDRAEGAYLYDIEGKQYVDYVGSWGACILGHNHKEVNPAIKKAVDKGISYGTATVAEIRMANRIIERMPNIEMLRLVNSGTEATMSALRLARAFTKRDKIIKFTGCYHGHSDSFLVKAGSGALTLGVPTSPGVTSTTAADTLTARFNDIDSVIALIDAHPDQVAAVIVEPVVGNSGIIPPQQGFLEKLRELTLEKNILLIFDEVMTGFRVSTGGAQELYGIKPDLSTLGKIIGGGMPIGAFGGRAEIMQMIAPSGPVYQAGTLSGNPVAVATGLATLNELSPEVYRQLEGRAIALEQGIKKNLALLSLGYQFQRVGSMSCLFFIDKPVTNYEEAIECDAKAYARYFHAMLKEGFYLPPSQYEAFFISAAHSNDDIDRTIEANFRALKETSG